MSVSQSPSPEILSALAERADSSGFIELPDFIETALYYPNFGYYRREKQRVGRNAKSDFYTSVSLREAFAEIVVEACCGLLRSIELDPSETHWLELGAEPGGSLLQDSAVPFKSVSAIGIEKNIEIPDQCILFSNELFDAQSFRQMRFNGDAWVEFGVRLDGQTFAWAERSEISPEAASYLPELPETASTGYTIDLPTGSRALAADLLNRKWSGVFVAFDYGKMWQSIVSDTPQGTARGYQQHRQLPNILETPGSIDITHHICWDHLENKLVKTGFDSISLQSQESFVVRRAPEFLQKAFDPNLPTFAPIRQKLKELVHPAFMGQKFQALTGVRRTNQTSQTQGLT